MPTFQQRFRELTSGMTQTEIAARLGIAQGSVSNFLTKQATPSVPILQTICEEFNCSMNWLIGLPAPRTLDPSLASVCAFFSLPEGAVQKLASASMGGSNETLASLLESDDFYLLVSLLAAAKDSGGNISDPDSVYWQRRYLALRSFEHIADILTRPEEENNNGKHSQGNN